MPVQRQRALGSPWGTNHLNSSMRPAPLQAPRQTLLHPLPHAYALQARPAGCGTLYLGASATNCSNAVVSLHSFGRPSALLKWRLAD